jgi:glycosyltransferase involved in cell wall biosynthesis
MSSVTPSVAIVTRNAIHGGVETMVAMHQRLFDATVFVAGGSDHPETCPFRYTYIDGTDPVHAHARLTRLLRPFDVVIYHWLPTWAQESVRRADRPCVEVVHREDTSDNDKTIPDLVVTHSQYLADFLLRTMAVRATVIPHGVEVVRYPFAPSGTCVGAITSYYWNKGVDLLLSAWAQLEPHFPRHRLRFYGAGGDLPTFERMVNGLGVRAVELLGPAPDPAPRYAEYCLFVQPSRAEGLPFAILEALATNVPVIASDLPAMVEFNHLAEQRGWRAPLTLFRVEDSVDLAEKMGRCLREIDGGESDVATSREYIDQFYGPERHRRLYSDAMEQAIELRRQRVAQERRWQGWDRSPKQIASNLYRLVTPRRARQAVWAYRHRRALK